MRYKEGIKPMNNTSEALFALKPVTFRYKKELDPQGIQQWGLVAEDVQKVHPALVALDKEGKPYSVRYEAVNAMLLNEFLKEHRTVEDLKATAAKQQTIIEQQQNQIAAQKLTAAQQQKQIDALTTGLQKLNATVELNKATPTHVADNR
jgi:uncharacterized coiled-coil protein SlyX